MEGDRRHTYPGQSGSGVLKKTLDEGYLLPAAYVHHLMRSVMPDDTVLTDDAKEVMQQRCSEFIICLTAHAGEIAERECRKTILAEDMVCALRMLGLEQCADALRVHLNRRREDQARLAAAASPPAANGHPAPALGGGGGGGAQGGAQALATPHPSAPES